ncbi:Protein EDS1B [Raphanus sativus]|uniref:Protein EDS1B n=1 Tax=Raphanus sativus TaxID=3726 RepID=A0A6J0LBA8_RAPSA|nr:protein EDS1B [Raphanus sativus]KAJ4910438.1 Protein EDS1B [Raphanus sativus]
MALDALPGLSSDLIATSLKESTKGFSNDHFHQEVEDDTVFFAFRPSFLVNNWFGPENESSFGETKMNRAQFPCMISFSNDVDADARATVNEAFLKNLQLLISTSFPASVKTLVEKIRPRRIVFTGHSSGGATAILATVWYLETFFTKKSSNEFSFPEPLCLTFGAPLVGDYVFKHALGRENWGRLFFNFVTIFDIVPRIMLAPKASTKQALPYALSLLGRRASIQENDQTIADFYATVMKDVETAARQANCELIGDGGNAFLETFSSFLELSPYRPAGTFVFSTGTRLVAMDNSDVILQILFYASQSSNERELSLRPNQSIRDHHSYQEMVDSNLDMDHLALDESALIDFGLSTSAARECVHAAFEAEKKRVDNQSKIETTKQSKIVDKLKWIEEEYKQPRCQAPAKGYYDSFKESNEENDFNANVTRAELAGSFDDVLGLLKKGQLPDGFEGSSVWTDLVTRYRKLMEPLDIGNYYRHLKNEDTGSYMEKGRPKRYKHAQKLYEHVLLKAGRSAEEIEASGLGPCFWAEVEELRGIAYNEARVNRLEELLQGWIRDKEVDDEHIFLEGSTFRKWWQSLPEVHRSRSCLRVSMG